MDWRTLYADISSSLQASCQTTLSDFLFSSEADLQEYANMIARKRKLPYQPFARDMVYLLTEHELPRLRVFETLVDQKIGQARLHNRTIVLLGENPEVRCRWSLVSNRLPSLTKGDKKDWILNESRLVTLKEKLLLMGWPVFPGISELGDQAEINLEHAYFCVGNSMHVSQVALVTLCALLCNRLVDESLT
jgi:hypothetical protein